MVTRPLRIVIDTNVWVSYLFWPSDTLGAAIRLAIHHGEILVSEATLDELSATLGKSKFQGRITEKERLSFFADVAHVSIPIAPAGTVADCRDPHDNRFLELAASGKADVIISGDADLLSLHPWRGVTILTPRRFVAYMLERA